jgi:hypothetical protein
MREYIFGHVQRGAEPLTGEALVDAICEVARSLPGFDSYCSHQADLEQRAMSYARSIQASHYYPFGSKHQAKAALLPESLDPPKPNWNQTQSQAARDRIQTAFTDLRQRHALPETTTARREAIRAYGIGNQTLDKYKELWHPKHLKAVQGEGYHPVDADPSRRIARTSYRERATHPVVPTSLCRILLPPQGQAERQKKFGGLGGFPQASPSQLIAASLTGLKSTSA